MALSAQAWIKRAVAEMSGPPAAGEPPVWPPPPPAVPGRHRGYIAVARRGDVLVPVGPVTRDQFRAREDVAWWDQNDQPGAFVCELREVPR